jgi:hypothetical protein
MFVVHFFINLSEFRRNDIFLCRSYGTQICFFNLFYKHLAPKELFEFSNSFLNVLKYVFDSGRILDFV